MNLNYNTYTYLEPISWPPQPQTWCSYWSPESYRLTMNTSLPYGSYRIFKNGGNSTRGVDGKLVLRENNYHLELTRIRCAGSTRRYYCSAPYGYRQDNMLVSCGGQLPTIPSITYPGDAWFLAKLLENWKDSDFNVGVSVGEGIDTLNSVANAGIKLGKAANALRKGNLPLALRNLSRVPGANKRDAARALEVGDLASTWMALRYGWIPLLSDISALRDIQYAYTGRKKVTASYWEPKPMLPLNDWMTVEGYTKQAWKWIAFLKPEDPDPYLCDRLGLTDPLTIGWELVPFSFVVDWFIPVSRLLNALAAIRLVPITTITKVSYRKTQYRMTPGPGNPYNFLSVSGDLKYLDILLDRSVDQPPPAAADLFRSHFYPKRINVQHDTVLKRAVDSVMIGANQINKLGGTFRR